MLYTSSGVTAIAFPNFAVYSGTKTHNLVLASLISRRAKKSMSLKDLVDFQALCPAGVSTNLNHFPEVNNTDMVTPDDCALGSLGDLGSNTMAVFGAASHTLLGRVVFPLIAWSPEVNKAAGFEQGKDPHVISD